MKKGISLLLAVIMTVSCLALAFSASAADYPNVYTFVNSASVGEKVPIMFTYMPAYNYEQLEVVIYDSDEIAVASANFEFNNKYASSIQHFTATWDTTGYEAGLYTIEVNKFFYSFNTWNEAPYSSTFTIRLIDDLENGDQKRNAYSGAKETIEKSSYDTVSAKKNTICSAYSAWDEVIINKCMLRLTEMYLGQTANTMVNEENPYNPKADSETNWIFMKFKLYNGTSKEIKASDLINLYLYKSTGNMATVLDYATMGGNRTGHYSMSSVTVQPRETGEFYFAVLMPKSQGMPYIEVDDVYLNTNPSAKIGEKHYTESTVTKATTSENGKITYKCSVCGNNVKTETIYRPKTITLSYTEKSYTGESLKPKVTVKDSKGNIIDAKNYTVSYKNNKSVGKATVTVKFKGNYTGTKTLNFTITPKQVTSLKVSSVKTTSITLAWSKVTGAKYYKLEKSTDGKNWTTVTRTDNTSYTVKTLKSGTKYQFRVTALDSTKKIAGKSSAVLKTATLTGAPSVTLKSSKSKTATASWKKVTGASKYVVYKSTDGKKWSKVTTTTKTSYTFTKLTGGKKIYVKVTALNVYGKTSAASTVKNVTV